MRYCGTVFYRDSIISKGRPKNTHSRYPLTKCKVCMRIIPIQSKCIRTHEYRSRIFLICMVLSVPGIKDIFKKQFIVSTVKIKRYSIALSCEIDVLTPGIIRLKMRRNMGHDELKVSKVLIRDILSMLLTAT